MNDTSFDKLEKRVAEAIALIGRLRAENRELREGHQQLARELGDLQAVHERAKVEHRALQDERGALQQTVSRLNGEMEELRHRSIDREEFEGRKRELESRVETLLERFTELDQAGLF